MWLDPPDSATPSSTWCPPCIAEMPNIQSLYKKVNKDKIAFVMLSVDKAGLDRVKKFIDRKGYDFPIYTAKSEIPQEFYANVIPTEGWSNNNAISCTLE